MITLLATLALTATDTSTAPRLTALEATIVLKVVHATQARKDVVGLAQAAGGFSTLVSDQEVVLKVPPEQLTALMQEIGAQGLTIEKSLVRHDVTEEVAKLEGSLRSKGEILGRLRKFFSDSNVAATLQIERSMTELVAELERVKGELRVARERARWATVRVAFQYRQVGRVQYVESPFSWLNSVDLDAFVGRFEAK